VRSVVTWGGIDDQGPLLCSPPGSLPRVTTNMARCVQCRVCKGSGNGTVCEKEEERPYNNRRLWFICHCVSRDSGGDVDKGARSNVWAHAAVDGAALEYKTFMALV
jgi:hypothetical protein